MEHTLRQVARLGVARVVVVTGCEPAEVLERCHHCGVGERVAMVILHDPAWERGTLGAVARARHGLEGPLLVADAGWPLSGADFDRVCAGPREVVAGVADPGGAVGLALFRGPAVPWFFAAVQARWAREGRGRWCEVLDRPRRPRGQTWVRLDAIAPGPPAVSLRS